MEVYFVDVGQGSCNVILIGNREAIVVDTGRRSVELSGLLHHLRIDYIHCLVLSHIDADHADGAPALLTEFRGRIGRICYPNDHRITETPFWAKLHEELSERRLARSQLLRLEYEDAAKTVWSSTTYQAHLRLLSPTFGENQQAIRRHDANGTSGVLVLDVHDRCIVFPGDSSLEQWKEILKRRNGAALECNIVAVAHHGGIIWPAHLKPAEIEAELNWLYQHALRPRHAIISVGTSNIDGHPRKEVLRCLKDLNVLILPRHERVARRNRPGSL